MRLQISPHFQHRLSSSALRIALALSVAYLVFIGAVHLALSRAENLAWTSKGRDREVADQLFFAQYLAEAKLLPPYLQARIQGVLGDREMLLGNEPAAFVHYSEEFDKMKGGFDGLQALDQMRKWDLSLLDPTAAPLPKPVWAPDSDLKRERPAVDAAENAWYPLSKLGRDGTWVTLGGMNVKEWDAARSVILETAATNSPVLAEVRRIAREFPAWRNPGGKPDTGNLGYLASLALVETLARGEQGNAAGVIEAQEMFATILCWLEQDPSHEGLNLDWFARYLNLRLLEAGLERWNLDVPSREYLADLLEVAAMPEDYPVDCLRQAYTEAIDFPAAMLSEEGGELVCSRSQQQLAATYREVCRGLQTPGDRRYYHPPSLDGKLAELIWKVRPVMHGWDALGMDARSRALEVQERSVEMEVILRTVPKLPQMRVLHRPRLEEQIAAREALVERLRSPDC